jgi:hypothetical protein
LQWNIAVGNPARVVDGVFRLYSSGQRLQLFLTTYIFALFVFGKNQIKYSIYFIIVLLAQIFSFSRSHYLATLLGLILVIIVYFAKTSLFRKPKALFFTLAIVALFFIINSFTSNILFERFLSGFTDYNSNQGTSLLRQQLLLSRFANIKGYMFMGLGYGVMQASKTSYDIGIQITNDSGIGNILIAFGFMGVAVFSIVYFNSIRLSLRLIKKTENIFLKTLAISLAIFQIQILFISYIADSYFYSPGIICLAMSWGLLVITNRIISKQSRRIEGVVNSIENKIRVV